MPETMGGGHFSFKPPRMPSWSKWASLSRSCPQKLGFRPCDRRQGYGAVGSAAHSRSEGDGRAGARSCEGGSRPPRGFSLWRLSQFPSLCCSGGEGRRGVLRGGWRAVLGCRGSGRVCTQEDGWKGRGEGDKALFHQDPLFRDHCPRQRIEHPRYLAQPCFCAV